MIEVEQQLAKQLQHWSSLQKIFIDCAALDWTIMYSKFVHGCLLYCRDLSWPVTQCLCLCYL